MSSPFDPEETHDSNENTEHHLFDDPNSMTWGAADPEFDEMLRDRLGPMPTMPTPPYAFERVLVAGRRRRARKVWTGAAAAAFVVMAGTAGTTVALNSGNTSGTVIGEGSAASSSSAPTFGVTSQTPAPAKSSASPAPTTASTTPTQATPTPSASASTTPQCASDTFTLAVSTATSGSGSTPDELIIVLTNTSGHACLTYGYPGLELETASGQLQSTTVTRINKTSAQHLTVAANQSVSTTAAFTAPASGATAGAGCAAPSSSLAVIPPNNEQQITQTITGGPLTVCGNGVLDTTPLVMGSSG